MQRKLLQEQLETRIRAGLAGLAGTRIRKRYSIFSTSCLFTCLVLSRSRTMSAWGFNPDCNPGFISAGYVHTASIRSQNVAS